MGNNNIPWTSEEDKILIENYSQYGSKYCQQFLKRTCKAIIKRASILKLKSERTKIKYSKEKLQNIISESKTFSEVLQKLNLRVAGGNFKMIKNHITKHNISIAHFTPDLRRKEALKLNRHLKAISLERILVENSTYSRSDLKKRLYKEGLKERKCELCGQDESWHGKHMSLIIDHINGVWNDNRLENLRIVCPNCNATLETHCRGTKKKKEKKIYIKENGEITNKNYGKEYIEKRKVKKRPSLDTLKLETTTLGFSATGRKYGVSDNAIRLWIKNLQMKTNTELTLMETNEIKELVAKAIETYPEKVKEYKEGKKGLLGLFMGEVMKLSKGQADPKTANELCKEALA